MHRQVVNCQPNLTVLFYPIFFIPIRLIQIFYTVKVMDDECSVTLHKQYTKQPKQIEN